MIRRTEDAPARASGDRRVYVPSEGRRRTGPRGRMERIPGRLDEADLPAQEASPRQGARLSRPHEDDGRSPRPGCAPGTRSQAPVSLTAGRGPRPRLEMLSSPQDFEALQQRGSIRSHPLLSARVLRAAPRPARARLAPRGASRGGGVKGAVPPPARGPTPAPPPPPGPGR